MYYELLGQWWHTAQTSFQEGDIIVSQQMTSLSYTILWIKKWDYSYYSISTVALSLTFLTVVMFCEYHFGMLLYLSNVITILVSTCSLVQLMLGITQNHRTSGLGRDPQGSLCPIPSIILSFITKKSRHHKPKMTNLFLFPIFNIFYRFWFAGFWF